MFVALIAGSAIAGAHAQSPRPLAMTASELMPAPLHSAIAFTPPDESTIPNSPLGDMIRFGRDVFVDTQKYAKKYVGNGLNCVNCHLDAGRAPNSGPMWAAYVAYPAFRTKDNQINTFERRLEGCFRFSMNGRMPPADDIVIVGLVSYAYWLATGAPVGAQLAGRGFPDVPAPPQAPDTKRGATVFAAECAACHGADGAGSRPTGVTPFRRYGAVTRSTSVRACIASRRLRRSSRPTCRWAAAARSPTSRHGTSPRS